MTRIVFLDRYGLVNEADAARALENGLVSGLGFDVLIDEPPSGDNPILSTAHRPDVISSAAYCMGQCPGHASSLEAGDRDIVSFLAGDPKRVVNQPAARGRDPARQEYH